MRSQISRLACGSLEMTGGLISDGGCWAITETLIDTDLHRIFGKEKIKGKTLGLGSTLSAWFDLAHHRMLKTGSLTTHCDGEK